MNQNKVKAVRLWDLNYLSKSWSQQPLRTCLTDPRTSLTKAFLLVSHCVAAPVRAQTLLLFWMHFLRGDVHTQTHTHRKKTGLEKKQLQSG